MTNLNALLARVREARENATQGRWSSYYHNRTDTWAITFQRDGCDEFNDVENLIASVPDQLSAPGSAEYCNNFDFMALAANEILTLVAIIEVQAKALEKIEPECRASIEAWHGPDCGTCAPYQAVLDAIATVETLASGGTKI